MKISPLLLPAAVTAIIFENSSALWKFKNNVLRLSIILVKSLFHLINFSTCVGSMSYTNFVLFYLYGNK